jgi:cytochrome c
MEFNKIFAAILVAGIVASLSGFIADSLIGEHEGGGTDYHSEGAAVAVEAPELPEPVLALIAAADIERGKKLSKACAACHSFDNGGGSSTGPNLWDVVGRSKAGKIGFSYSQALEQAGGNWDYTALNKFLWKPKKYISGTKMNFVGIKKPEDRAAMIAWLRTLAGSPAALPSQAEIDAEAAELGN